MCQEIELKMGEPKIHNIALKMDVPKTQLILSVINVACGGAVSSLKLYIYTDDRHLMYSILT